MLASEPNRWFGGAPTAGCEPVSLGGWGRGGSSGHHGVCTRFPTSRHTHTYMNTIKSRAVITHTCMYTHTHIGMTGMQQVSIPPVQGSLVQVLDKVLTCHTPIHGLNTSKLISKQHTQQLQSITDHWNGDNSSATQRICTSHCCWNAQLNLVC